MKGYKPFRPCNAPAEYAFLKDDRNPYYLKLLEYPDQVFTGDRTEQYAGRWISEVFRRSEQTELHVEVGVGYGHSFSANVRAHPETAFVGLDYSYKPLYRAAKKLKTGNLSNARLLLGRAQRLLRIFGPEEIHRVYILFPDPWETRKRWSKRLLSPGFFIMLGHCMKSGGTVWVKTDHQEYFKWFLDQLRLENINFTEVFATMDLHATEHPAKEMVTHFEEIFLAKQYKVCFAEFVNR